MDFVCCAVCGGYNALPLFSKWGYIIVQCRTCSLAYVNPRTFAVEEDRYFRGAYLANIEDNGSLNAGIKTLYSQILSNLETYLHPSRLLDVGCAMGHFMVEARDRGWEVVGVECSPYASEYAKKRWGLDVRQACDLRDATLKPNHFDACVLIEVAEHLPQPRETFSEVFRVLKPGGVLYVTTPNFASFRSLLQQEEWTPVIPTGHLYYFAANSLARLLAAIGYVDPIDLTLPARLDDEVKAINAGGGSISWRASVDEIRQRTTAEDSAKVSNGRGEGLIMCARKPWVGNERQVAALRFTESTRSFEGKLIRIPGHSEEEQKVYFVSGGRKHWVVTTDWLAQHSLRLQDTIEVDRSVLASILTGEPISDTPATCRAAECSAGVCMGARFFIVGCQRTGTTLLRLILEAHPEIFCYDELKSYAVLQKRHLEDAPPKRLIGFKIPRWTEQLARPVLFDEGTGGLCENFYQGEKILFLLRGVNDTIASMLKLKEGESNWCEMWVPRFIERKLAIDDAFRARYCSELATIDKFNKSLVGFAALYWKYKTEAFFSYRERGFPVIGVPYEDLVSDPQATLSSICVHLGVPFNESLLRHSEYVHSELFANGLTVGSTDPTKAIYSDSVRQWRRFLTPDDLDVISEVSGDLPTRIEELSKNPTP